MREFVSGTQMKQLDRYTIQEIGIPSLVLMERAARSVYDTMIKKDFRLKKYLFYAEVATMEQTVWRLQECCIFQIFRLMWKF